ncbi:hypothetical protein ACIBQ1_04005 [Nonomuraea sp. NPDC050153]|uniref:hypothetical protein n=1 Tax=Nonomuraea sp. NPDC050153 TaxID=3364359 RepID=UPI00379F6E28
MHIGQPFLRATRAAVFAAVCVLVSAALHGLAGGDPVHTGTLLGALTLTWTGAFLLGGRRRGLEVLLAACFAAQYGMHHLFSAGAAAPPPPHEHVTGVGMFLVHAVTAVLSAWWLARGESALAVLLHLAVASIDRWWGVLSLLTGGPVEASPSGGRPTARDGDAFLQRLFAAAIFRRGPPARFSLV